MNVKTVVPLCSAAVLGLAAAIVASQLVRQRPVVIDGKATQSAIELTDVVVAAHDLAPGQPLKIDDLAVVRFDAKTLPLDAPRSIAPLVNRVVKLQVPRGQVIHPASMLADAGVLGGLAAAIPAGMRAMTLEVNEFTGVAGLVEPGNRIDVLARVKESDADKAGDMTRTIAQDVQVVAVGQTLTNRQAVTDPTSIGGDKAKLEADGQLPASKAAAAPIRSITVLVTPEQAERLDLALGQNPTMAVRMSLRSPVDREATKTEGATLASLRVDAGEDAPATLASSKQPARTPGADDVFGPNGGKPTFKPATADAGGQTRSVTVIRAGVATLVEVEQAGQPPLASAVPVAARRKASAPVAPPPTTTRPADFSMSSAAD